MLTKIIPASAYEQYADDDDVQAFFQALNDGGQTYLDWFNNVGLAYYPGLTGDLLDWVAEGLYGIQRPALEQQGLPAIGTLNTQELNSAPLNTFTPPTASTGYALSNDMFQRILTWNLYKGDGKNFNMRWLKRRVMRFLVGANGIDPDPSQPGFVVGAENTMAIGAQVASGTLTVTIHRSVLATVAPAVTAQTITLFSLIFPAGILDLPARYQYACTLS
jgi:hypothetical protein